MEHSSNRMNWMLFCPILMCLPVSDSASAALSAKRGEFPSRHLLLPVAIYRSPNTLFLADIHTAATTLSPMTVTFYPSIGLPALPPLVQCYWYTVLWTPATLGLPVVRHRVWDSGTPVWICNSVMTYPLPFETDSSFCCLPRCFLFPNYCCRVEQFLTLDRSGALTRGMTCGWLHCAAAGAADISTN